MKKEVVKYENSLNEINLGGFLAVDLDLFMLICSKTKEHQSELLRFPFSELKKAVGMANKTDGDFLAYLNRMSMKVKRIGGSYKTNEQFFEFNLFSDFYGTLIDVTADNEETKQAYKLYGEVPKNTLVVSVNPRYAFLLNEMKSYTKFDLQEFVNLESKYSKNLYRLLKQYRRTGKYQVSAEKFRALMGCPESYPNKEFMRVCVNVAVKELSQGYFENLKVNPVHSDGRGRPIIAYEFTFKKSKETPGQYSFDDIVAEEPKKPTKPKKAQQTKINDFPQRNYDYDVLERLLQQAQQADLSRKESE